MSTGTTAAPCSGAGENSAHVRDRVFRQPSRYPVHASYRPGTHGDFEHCEVAVFIGKNPWQSHGFARARATIHEMVKDPKRSIVVIDPRRSETAAKADFHLAIRPGTDAWCLAALVADRKSVV